MGVGEGRGDGREELGNYVRGEKGPNWCPYRALLTV